jgi:antitoxin ParD1/3/4
MVHRSGGTSNIYVGAAVDGRSHPLVEFVIQIGKNRCIGYDIRMRSVMNVSLPPVLKQWVDEQVKDRGFGTASEFIRDMLRRAREKSAHDRIEQALLRAVDTPISPMTDQDWRDIASEGRKLAKKRAKK